MMHDDLANSGRLQASVVWAQVVEMLCEDAQTAIQSPLYRRARNSEYLGGSGKRHPLNPYQVERLTLVIRQVIDCFEHSAIVQSEAGVTCWVGYQFVVQFDGARLFI
jgi:hypothetical protein